jgi:drug/metabolite transporter (DMT)-like permease
MTDTGSSRGTAYATLAVLTLVWAFNWIVMKLALANADPVILNLQRTWLAVVVLFGLLIARRRGLRPTSWKAVIVTGFFQTTVNFGATIMAVAGGGAGRASVLVFTMPFWTLLIARFVLNERVRGLMGFAAAFAFLGMVLVVAPWDWTGSLAPKLWAVLSGLGWAAGTVCTKYFQRDRRIDMLNFMAWQMLFGVLPLTILPFVGDYPATRWSPLQGLLLFYIGALSTAGGFIMWVAVLRRLPAGTASLNTFSIPVIALVSSMLLLGERLTANEWLGIGAIGAGLVLLSLQVWRGTRGVPGVR